eukprot:6490920-Amphidinium_carterae.6
MSWHHLEGQLLEAYYIAKSKLTKKGLNCKSKGKGKGDGKSFGSEITKRTMNPCKLMTSTSSGTFLTANEDDEGPGASFEVG